MANVGNDLEDISAPTTESNIAPGAGTSQRRMKLAQSHTGAEVQPNVKGNGLEAKSGSAEGPQGGRVRFFIMCFLGIFVSYFIYGLFQEKITKRKFGDEYFRFFLFMVMVQCVINAIFARVVCSVRRLEASLQPHFLFSCLAFTYVGAMVASNSSLTWVSYPTQVLGKSAKPIPILFLGVLIGGKQYPHIKYLIVLLIVVGVALFFYEEGNSTENQSKFLHIVGFGELLILISLTLDGLTGTIQEKLRSIHEVSAHHMMYAVNTFSAVYLIVAVVVTGELSEVLAFIQRHPEVLLNIAVFSVSSAIGQNFIFLTVTHFGPLTTSIITTTRKFFTILSSVLFFGNALPVRRWVGVTMVFLGLGIDAYYGKASRSK